VAPATAEIEEPTEAVVLGLEQPLRAIERLRVSTGTIGSTSGSVGARGRPTPQTWC
jgi:hypothetical protein